MDFREMVRRHGLGWVLNLPEINAETLTRNVVRAAARLEKAEAELSSAKESLAAEDEALRARIFEMWSGDEIMAASK